MIRRRELLTGSTAALASLCFSDVVFGAAPTSNRLVVIILRGGMDALEVLQPYADRDFATLRPTLRQAPETGLLDLDGHFGLRHELLDLHKMFKDAEACFVHAVSTPYRNRSHFDGQDVLETGLLGREGVAGGWLNRLLGIISPGSRRSGVDVSRMANLVMSGDVPYEQWYPGTSFKLSEENEHLLKLLYASDPMFRTALMGALDAQESDTASTGSVTDVEQTAIYTAVRLSEDARLASFSIGGWDSHREQATALSRPLKSLNAALATLKTYLGPVWDQTLVVAVSEFGRTARENGSRGTDHGTGGLLMFAGGRLRSGAGGRILSTKWPGLGDGDLYEGRDLAATDDVRRYIGWALIDLFGITPVGVTSRVFPNLDLGGRLPILS